MIIRDSIDGKLINWACLTFSTKKRYIKCSYVLGDNNILQIEKIREQKKSKNVNTFKKT